MTRKQLEAGSSINRIKYLIYCLVLPILLLLILDLLANNYSPAHAQIPLLGKEKIGPGVVETLRLDGEVRVVIALVEPSSAGMKSLNLNKVRNDISILQDAVISSLDSSDFSITHKYQAVPALSGNLITESGLYKLAANPYVVKIDLDVGGTGSLATSVPLIGADTWHGAGNMGNGVVIAVLDSGLDTDHSDLAPALIHQECFLDDDGVIDGNGLCPNGSDRQSGSGSAEDDAGHGTHVTGIIASRGNQSSVGVAPGVSIVAIKVTAGPSFSGTFYYFSEIVAALDFIINNRPDVQIINMSLVTYAQFSGDCDNTTSWNMAGAAAINTLRSLGVISFASSGNSGSGTLMSSPACLRNVISVGATDNNDTVASFTSSNSSTDITAPGVGILSSAMGNGTTTASGTSMASPHAAGCAALFIASHEAVTPDQIETRLKTSPVQVVDAKNGLTFPRIDCSLKLITEVNISGPITGTVYTTYNFISTVSPITATQPITYTWAPVPESGQGTASVEYTWAITGTQTIVVTATNMTGVQVSDSHTIIIEGEKPSIYLPIILLNSKP